MFSSPSQGGGAAFPLGESTLALDEEMLRVLDAADPVKPVAGDARPTTQGARGEPGPSRSLAPVVDNKGESGNGAPLPTGPHGDPKTQQRDCGSRGDRERPGWRAECKDLAQRLLFSEDSEEVGHAQRGPEDIRTSPASACINSQHVGTSNK